MRYTSYAVVKFVCIILLFRETFESFKWNVKFALAEERTPVSCYVSLLIVMQNNFTTACISEKIALTKYHRRYYSILSPVFTIIKILSIFFRPVFISISIVDLKLYASGLHQCLRLQDISTLGFSTMNFQHPFLRGSLNISDGSKPSWLKDFQLGLARDLLSFSSKPKIFPKRAKILISFFE